MKFTSAFSGVAFRQTWPVGGGAPHMSSISAPVGGWKTTTSPTSGSEKRAPMRLTSTRWPISSVGTIDSDGIRYGLTRNAWMPSASPRATTTIMISSSSELDAEEARFTLLVVVGRRGLGGLGDRRLIGAAGGIGRLGLGERLLVDRLARHLVVGRRGGGRLGLDGGIVQQAGLDERLRPRVATLPHPGALADATAQVVELGPAHVAARGDLDALDLGRVHGERALDADAEGLLADREGLAHSLALALDDDALEDLGTTAGALDDLEVDADAIAGLEGGDAAELRALQAVDDGAHGEEDAARGGPLARRRLR